MMSPLWRKRLFLLLLPVLLGVSAATLKFKADISAFFIAGDNAEELLLASEIQSGTLSRRYLLSIGSASGEPVPAAFTGSLSSAFRGIDGVVDVWQPGRQRIDIEALQALYAPHSAQMYSRHPEEDLPLLLSEDGLQERARLLKKALLSPQSALVKKIALQDPLLLTLNAFKGLAGRMQGMLSEDRRYQNLILETRASGLDAAVQKRIQQQLRTVFASRNADAAYTLEMTGVPVFAVATQTLIETDITRVSVFSSVALVLLFLWLFRSLRALFWVASVLVAAVAVSVIVTQALFGFVHGMTMAIGTTLVGVCIDYPIHALVHARSVPMDERFAVVGRIWPSMLMGGITTLVGYSALAASGYPGFQQVSLYAGCGIVAALLLSRHVLPGCIGNAGKPSDIPASNAWIAFCARFRWLLLGILSILAFLALAGMQKLNWMTDLRQLTPELAHLQSTDRKIRSRMTSIEPGRFILVSGSSVEKVLQNTEQVYDILDQLKKQGDLRDYFGLYPWLLSQRQQRSNQQLLAAGLTDEVRSDWRQALRKQDLSVRRLGELSYPERPPLQLRQVLDSPVGRLIDSQIVQGEHKTLIIIWIGAHDPEILRQRFAGIDSARYFSQRDLLNRMAGDYLQRAKKMLLLGLTVIFLLLWLRYKSPLKTLQTILPALLAALLILAGWSWTGVPISFLHLVGFLLAVAICVDYGIFYQENRAANIALTYRAMRASMLTSAVAFASLAMATTTALQTLGVIVATGVVLGFLLCPVLIRHSKKDRHRVTEGRG